jgi:hypothetical protein
MPPAVASPTTTIGYLFILALEKYTITDINILESIAKGNEEKDKERAQSDPLFGTGRCTTALASLCFATFEQVGLILRNDLDANTVGDAIKYGNLDNAKSFFSFFSSKGLHTMDSAELLAVYYLFRNKITHNLFPKHNLGVSQNASNPLDEIVNSVNSTFGLNVNFLSNYILNAIPILKALLSDPANAELIIMVDNNIQLINSKELEYLKNKFHEKAELQTYFTNWLPGIDFTR